MALAAVFFSMMGVVVKSLKGLPTHEIVFFRGLITAIYCYGFLKYRKIPVLGNNKKILIIRGLSGSMALYCFFHTLKVLPLSEATAIQKLSPFFVLFIAAAVSGQKLQLKQVGVFCSGTFWCILFEKYFT
jgi:drug/metabolite transporter (DMT)-like permease